jgi:photosystem II stability/assembly factor-like uncharacterized protein
MHRFVTALITVSLFLAGAQDAFGGRPRPAGPTPAEDRWEAWEQRKLLDADSPFAALPWRCVGPVVQGGRLVDIAVHPDDPYTFWVAYASGGLWKTTNNGLSFEPLFDEQPTMIMGDIALDPQDPQTIWVGTGENNSSRSSYSGLGVFRSRDGGETFEHMGLSGSDRIGRILVDPRDSDRVLVAVLGALYTKHSERGLFLTKDGGASWQRVLEGKGMTGFIDLVRDPADPDLVYATSWERSRRPWDFVEGGEGSGIWRSTDAGDSWTLLTNGLPDDEQSRIGLVIAPSNPQHLYASYTGTDYNLYDIYESLDGGDSWSPVLDTLSDFQISPFALGGFGWYFGKIRVNPQDEDDIFVLGVDLWRSRDGGTNWEQAAPPWFTYEVHADKHDLLWNSRGEAILATDGGLYRSADDMVTWEDAENIPTTQFYRVAVNPHNPGFYYGGAQDNGSTGGAALPDEWERIFGGDGFQMVFHPDFPEIFFVETQNGRIRVTYDGGFGFQSAIDSIDGSDRRNWDMPYFLSTHDQYTMYTGTYRAYRSPDLGGDWEIISPDLTDGLIRHPRHHSISTIHESPLVADLIYVGTTDGNVWRKDAGTDNWTAIYQNLPDRYVSEVKASPTDVNTVFVSHTAYKDNDFRPYFFRSTDQGSSWTSIAGNLPNLAINDFYILPNTGDSVLFAGTDGGVYATVDAGTNWERLGNNFPYVPVYDLEYDPADNELIAGTFARSILAYPLDSLLNAGPLVSVSAPLVQDDSRLWLSPNPGAGPVQLHWQELAMSPLQLKWYNTNGQLLQQQSLNPGSENGRQQLQTPGDLAPGLYFLQVEQGQARWTLRWLRQ